MSKLESLINWFPSGTAEGERSILERVFVYPNELKKVLSPRPGNPYLLVGRKGTGKSAIVDFADRLLTEAGIPSIILKPDDISTSDIGENDSVGDMKSKFISIIYGAIGAKMVSGKNFIINGDDQKLYHAAVAMGHRSPDFVGKMAALLPSISQPLINADFSQVLPVLSAATKTELVKAIQSRIVDKQFHVFIDDTDQIANPDKLGHLNRIWSLILAAREICSDVNEVCILITLRQEIWERLNNEPASQRDQTDHFSNLIIRLSSNEQHLVDIVEKRLNLAAESMNLKGDPYQHFFDGFGAKAPQSKEARSWRDLIKVRARGRPRDAIQLIYALARQSIDFENSDLITQDTFQNVMPEFSKSRAVLFDQEMHDELTNALEILRSFCLLEFDEGGFKAGADQMKAHLRTLPSKFPISIRGRTVRQNNDEDTFLLWRTLYQADIINGRISDNRQKDGYRHIDSLKEPMFVSASRWNEMQAMLWEINPAFRDFLVTEQAAHGAKTGLPVRKPKSKARSRSTFGR